MIHLRIKIATLLMMLLSSCASRIKFNPEFVFWEQGGELRACLSKEKVIELKELLIEQEK